MKKVIVVVLLVLVSMQAQAQSFKSGDWMVAVDDFNNAYAAIGDESTGLKFFYNTHKSCETWEVFMLVPNNHEGHGTMDIWVDGKWITKVPTETDYIAENNVSRVQPLLGYLDVGTTDKFIAMVQHGNQLSFGYTKNTGEEYLNHYSLNGSRTAIATIQQACITLAKGQRSKPAPRRNVGVY